MNQFRNQNSKQIHDTPLLFSKIAKGICIFLIAIICFQNCFFNPVVASLLNPSTEDKQNGGLLQGGLLLGLSGMSFSVSITGVIRNGLGEAQTNKVWTVVASDANNPELGLSTSGTTDNAGRFFITIGQGSTTIKVTDLGEDLVTFTLQVGAFGMFQATNVDPPEYEIGSLIPLNPSSQPVFFELVSSSPGNNETVTNAPSSFNFTFSEPPQIPSGNQELWISENIIVNPSISMASLGFDANTMSVMVWGFSAETTTYTVALNPGITSQTGIPLTPRSFTFTCEAPCGP
ncbi:hypothetical protein EHQ82_16940 [Leptospira selangorensis]|uniref:SbsA Ig-like domain-containing protein n=1 Tax=Leptospira selangorensis TaxID=2484982 RepID=A0ABY2N4W7_9LEPT|nr:Ig-like domain-containing protein [Leptospira selangorensis]TGM16701.1 hypothetical protein EHQ82_16940 [Leptospira selangorensis]